MNRLLVFLLASILISCSSSEESKVETRNVLTLEPLTAKKIESDFSDELKEIKIIPLENIGKNSLIINIDKLLFDSLKNIIIFNNINVLKFSKDGKYQFKFGSSGKGPGEYIKIVDVCLNEDKSEVLILDSYANVLRFNIESGDFIDSHKAKWNDREMTYDAMAHSTNGGYYLFASNPVGNSLDSFDDKFYCLGEFDAQGNLISEHFVRRDFNFPLKRFSTTYDHAAIMRPLEGGRNDLVAYKLKNSEVKPFVKFEMGDEYIPDRFIFEFPGNNPWLNIKEVILSKYYKFPMDILDTQSFIYFWMGGPNGETHEFLYNKFLKEMIRWKSDEAYPFTFIGSDETYFYAVLSELTANENSAIPNPLKKYIEEKYDLKDSILTNNPSIVRLEFDNKMREQ